MRKVTGGLIWGLVLVSLIGAGLSGSGCRKRTASRIPPGIPTTLPSEQEARQIRKENAEAIPIVPQGGRGLGRDDLPPAAVEGVATDSLAIMTPGVETRYGYRVQIFATSNEIQASRRAEEIRQLFNEKVYVEYEGLLYKVRAGNCVSRDEASALQKKAVRLGCEGAFVIQTQIIIQ